jgi:hypothetical protein
MNVHDAGFQHHGCLSFFCRQDFQKKLLDVQATAFEYFWGMMNVKQSSFLPLGVRRRGTQCASSLFFDELVLLLEQITLLIVQLSSAVISIYTLMTPLIRMLLNS